MRTAPSCGNRPPAGTPGGSATARERRELLGGKRANQAVALSQLGVPVGRLVGAALCVAHAGGRPALSPEALESAVHRFRGP